jgi:transcriptional regulator with XRE-family HTH domain
MDADDEDKRAIADALRDHDGPEHRKAIAQALGVTVSQVSRWYRGLDRMTPRQVFAAEAALGLDPGELSAAAGFAPVGQAPGVAVAIGADGRLDERDRRMLQLLYREMVRAETVEPRGPAQREVAAKRRPGRSRR